MSFARSRSGSPPATAQSTLPRLGTPSGDDEKDDREQGEQGDENKQEPRECKHQYGNTPYVVA